MSDMEEDAGVPGDAGEDEFAGLPEEEEEFVDGEAGEDGEEGEGDGEGEPEGEDASADSSEEEEGSEQNEYEADGFVVDEEDAEDGDGEGGEASDQEAVRKKRKKRRRDKQFALDEEDYDLLEEAGVKRPEEQRKRLKRRGEPTKAAGAKQLRDELFGGDGDLEDELADLGPEGGADRDRAAAREDRRNRFDDEHFADDASDEMGDFIVGNETVDRRRERRDAKMALEQGLSTEAVQNANRMFGNFGELLDLHASHRIYGDISEEEEQPEEEEEIPDEEFDQDEQEAERRRLERQEKAAAKKQQRLLQHVDPELVDSHFLRPHDHTIRATDLPERLQLLGKSVLEGLGEGERSQLLNEAAKYVVEHLFGQRSQRSKVRDCVEDGVLEITGKCHLPNLQYPHEKDNFWPAWALSGADKGEWLDLRNNRAVLADRADRYEPHLQPTMRPEILLEKWRTDTGTQEQLRQNVLAVLTDIFERGEEVPVVAMFRKEEVGDLLALRYDDTPKTTGNDKTASTEDAFMAQVDVRYPRGTMQAKHRRIRRWDVLWAVFNCAVRYFDMHKRRQQRMDSYLKVYDRSAQDNEREGITVCYNMLQQGVPTAADMDDVDVKFRHVVEMASVMEALTVNGDGNTEVEPGGRRMLKRPGRANVLKRYLQRGLGEEAQKIFLSMVAFSENVQKLSAEHIPNDPDAPPEEWAEEEIRAMGLDDPAEQPRYQDISNPSGFLRALREILATDLAAEPILRSLVRKFLFNAATVSTKPTPAGNDVLDPFHPYGLTKHLHEKPVDTFEGHDTWLRILAAERAGLIKVEVEFKRDKDPVEMLADCYRSDNVGDAAKEWNAWRSKVVDYAVREKMVPVLLQELRMHLTEQAIETTITQVQDAFWKYVSQPPVRITEVSVDAEEDSQEPVVIETPRFMAVVWGAGGQFDGPTTIVQLDGHGNLKDFMTAAQLSGNVPRTVNSSSDRERPVFDPAADPKKSKDSQKIREKILEHKPNAILVATNAPQSKQIKDDMEKISQYTESDARFKDELLPHLENKKVEVYWSDHRLAALWANSDAAKAEFPDYSFQVRMAVGVGRLALDPLAIIAVLCGPKKGVLSLKMHDLQDMLPKEALAQRLEQTLITGVAQVGVDINAMVANPWRQGPLQFVPGLGPRKARALLAAIAASEDPFVKTRVELLKQADSSFNSGGQGDMAQLGKTVFLNAASCLRVRHGSVAALQNEAEFDAVDDIRIQPQNEPMLQIVLADAFDDMEGVETADVRAAIEAPTTLKALDLYSVAEHNNYEHKLMTLSDMLYELLAPYGEVRVGAASPSEEQAFYLRHGETTDSLKVGRLVEGKVVWVGEGEVKVILQNNGMEAFIPQDQVSSSDSYIKLGDVFRHGQVVTARILATDIGERQDTAEEGHRRKYNVTLSTTSAYLQDTEKWEDKYCKQVDSSYKLPDKQAGAGAATPSRRVPTQRRQLQARPIEHPLWRNLRGAEVAAELQEAPIGGVLFRPAMKPTAVERLSHISATIKLAALGTGPLMLNVDIKEAKDKPPKQSRLVPPLRIELSPNDEESYDDLDEVVARYVEPLVENVTQVRNHRKYHDGDNSAVNKHIRQMLSQQNAQSGAYCVAIDAARPGTAYIAYGAGGPESSIYREWFNITPKGFFFRQKTYSEVERVLDAFKRDPNYKKKQVAQGQQRMGGPPGPAGYGQPPPGYGQPGGFNPQGGYAPQQQQQQPPPGYGGGGYPGQPMNPYRPAPPAAAAGGYGVRPPGPPAPAAGGYYQGGVPPQPGYNPAAGGYQPGYNPAAGGYQPPPQQQYGYGQAR